MSSSPTSITIRRRGGSGTGTTRNPGDVDPPWGLVHVNDGAGRVVDHGGTIAERAGSPEPEWVREDAHGDKTRLGSEVGRCRDAPPSDLSRQPLKRPQPG